MLYQIRRGQRLSTRSLPRATLLNRWDNVDRAMIIIFEYVTIKERDPICNVVHIIVANWRRNIIRSIGDQFVAVGCWYDVYLQRFRGLCARRDGGWFICDSLRVAKGHYCCAANRPRRDMEIAPQCWQNSPLSRVRRGRWWSGWCVQYNTLCGCWEAFLHPFLSLSCFLLLYFSWLLVIVMQFFKSVSNWLPDGLELKVGRSSSLSIGVPSLSCVLCLQFFVLPPTFSSNN